MSTINLGRTRKTRKEVNAARRATVTSRNPPTQLPAPSSSSSSQPTSSHQHTPSSPATQPQSPLIISPSNSIFSQSAAPSAKYHTPAQSSSLPAAPERFIKVTDWKSIKPTPADGLTERRKITCDWCTASSPEGWEGAVTVRQEAQPLRLPSSPLAVPPTSPSASGIALIKEKSSDNATADNPASSSPLCNAKDNYRSPLFATQLVVRRPRLKVASLQPNGPRQPRP
nr:hypothetical protein Iba_chr04fCG15120 [Ipomoea batatas]